MIRLVNLSKTYDTKSPEPVHALVHVNDLIKAGELIIINGVSGSGKSTLLSLMAGLEKPTEGEVLIDEDKISKMQDSFSAQLRRDKIGFVFQKFNLVPELTTLNNVMTPLIPEKMNINEKREAALKQISRFSLDDKKDVPVKNLSGGQQQRVALARALVNNPSYILADEPSANLDRALTENLIEIFKELNSTGITIIIATHDPLFIEKMPEARVINIESGKIV